MLNDLLLLRAGSPRAFRGIRWFAGLLFWLFLVVMGLGFLVELGSSPEEHESHRHSNIREAR
jgi:hypothetical protein